eukprot:scaffold153753_cov31-Prasinocladus_malaysianus.AAC.1
MSNIFLSGATDHNKSWRCKASDFSKTADGTEQQNGDAEDACIYMNTTCGHARHGVKTLSDDRAR